jgi:hypothetical protein
MQWKEAILVSILKKDKVPTDPNSYRPISLRSCTAKFLKCMISTRLVWDLEKKGYLIPQQAASDDTYQQNIKLYIELKK